MSNWKLETIVNLESAGVQPVLKGHKDGIEWNDKKNYKN